MTTDEWCKKHNIERVNSIEELIEKSDCIDVLSPDNPEQHEALSRLALESGKRVYIDKTFAETKEIAERIFRTAEANAAPCFSSSALRFAAEYQKIDPSMVENLVSIGPGPLDTYCIHQIEPIVSLMGANVQRVMCVGTEKWPATVIEYRDGRRATMSHHGWESPFLMCVDYRGGSSEILEIKSDFFKIFINEMVDFFLNGNVKVKHEETIAVMGIREAAIKASKSPGEWIEI
ncbi:MAG: hypothetical protein RSC76_04585 [Oscillospiraceae bacterium]